MEIQLKKASLRLSTSSLLALTLAFAATPALSQALDPIMTFDQAHPLVKQSDDIPMVQVFADGTVNVNRRPGITNPGQYVLNLTEVELGELTTLAQTAGIVNFSDTTESNAIVSGDTTIIISDPTTTIMQFNRLPGSATLSAGDGTGPAATMQTIEVNDVVSNANANQNSPGMQAMKALHIKMIELFSKAGV